MPQPRSIHALLFTLACAAAAPAATTQPADAGLPVRAITLYTSGVGFFRHDGVVHGDGSVTLKFKTGQINDVIKSLVVQDAGGTVRGVQYPSQDPIDKTLKTFQIDLTDDPSMADLFKQLRGAKVTVDVGGESRSGTVVGVETQTVTLPPPAVAQTKTLLNLFDGVGLSQVPLDSVRSIKLDDPALAAELSRALAAVAAGRDQDKKPVTIGFTGPGDHRLRLGYVVETPVWKTAYRLLLQEPTAGKDDAAKATTEDRLQGWAVVENQTDSDWNDVTLSLVSGRPMSFVMDLYQPLYLQRPVVELSLFQGLKPPVYQEGVQNHAFDEAARSSALGQDVRASMAMSASPAPAGGNLFHRSLGGSPGSDEAPADYGQVPAAALTAKLGELFQYTIEHVSLPRQQSSLVPIVADKVEAEPISIYNETVLPRNPLTGVMLTNSTGKLLPQGPITVLSGGAYAGDARIEDLPAGQKRLLSFGVDLQTFVDVRTDSTSDIIGGKISRGILLLSRKESQTKLYAIENKADHDKTVVIENMLVGGWDLVDTPEPFEKTDRRYRFKLPAAHGKVATLKVTQQHTIEQSIAIVATDVNDILINSRQGAIPQKVRDTLIDLAKRRTAMADLDTQIKQRGEAIDRIGTEQTRIRENMTTVGKGGDYYTRLLKKLNDQESAIEVLQTDRDTLNATRDKTRADFERYLDGLNVE